MSKEAAVLELPPAPPAYVAVIQDDLSAPASKEIIEALKHVARGDGHEPPHDHVEEPAPPTSPPHTDRDQA